MGINGICIISHGHSSPKAIKNAVKAARDFHAKQVNRHIQEDIESMVAGLPAAPRAGQPDSAGGCEKEGAAK